MLREKMFHVNNQLHKKSISCWQKQDDASQKNILKKVINFFAEQRTILSLLTQIARITRVFLFYK